MKFKKILFPLTLLFLVSTLQAEEEKIVNFYNWADYIAPDTLANFEKEYGIKINYDIFDTTDIVDAKLLAGNSGYDLVLHSAAFAPRLIAAGVYQPIDRNKITNWHHLDPELMEKLAAFDPDNRYSVPYMWGTTGVAFNIDMLKERIPDVSLATADFFSSQRFCPVLLTVV
jgi:putrescine transport system substrate-binding protein